MIQELLKIVPLLSELFEGLQVEVRSIRFADMRAKPGDSLVLISAHLVSYQVKLRVSNTSQKHIGIRSVVLKINNRSYFLDDDGIPELFKPGESRNAELLFFNCDPEAASSGKYQLLIIDARGRKIKVAGQFPGYG